MAEDKSAEDNNSESSKSVPSFGIFDTEYLKQFAKFADRYKVFLENMRPIFKNVLKFSKEEIEERNKFLEELPASSRRAMELASNRGWFFCWTMSLGQLKKIIDELESADDNEVDSILSEHHKDFFEHHLEMLKKKYTHRSGAIVAACEAHLKGGNGYYLSVPVFLAQADGILSEVCNMEGKSALQVHKKGEPEKAGTVKIMELLKDRPDALDVVFPIARLHELDLLKSSNDRPESGLEVHYLNRHQILHGEESNYATEIISLKAYSFLTFVGLHLPDIIEDFKENSELAG